jgi:hypothetical protein
VTISRSVVTVGTAQTMVVPPSTDTQRVVLQNQQPEGDVGDYSRDGYVYLSQSFFNVPNGGTVSFAIQAGPQGAQFEFYSIVAKGNPVRAYLIEGATYTTGGTVTAYNMNRNYSDAYGSVLTSATSVTGGTVISSESVPASNQAGGSLGSAKIHTLRPSTGYAMSFTAPSGAADVHFELGFTEQYNGLHDIYLGTAGSAIRLRGGELITMDLYPGDAVYASANGTACALAIQRQD